MDPIKPALSALQVAYALRVSVATVTELVRQGKLRVLYRTGMKRFFHPEDVEAVRLERLAHPPSNKYRGVPRGRR